MPSMCRDEEVRLWSSQWRQNVPQNIVSTIYTVWELHAALTTAATCVSMLSVEIGVTRI